MPASRAQTPLLCELSDPFILIQYGLLRRTGTKVSRAATEGSFCMSWLKPSLHARRVLQNDFAKKVELLPAVARARGFHNRRSKAVIGVAHEFLRRTSLETHLRDSE